MTFILYGSQTGQAKSIAESLFDTLLPKINYIKIHELDELNKSYTFDKINIAIIICSTTGDGDAPENAEKFLRKIKSLESNTLATMPYTVLGLGDTNYSNFCNCGKQIDSILNLKGAQRFYSSRWADDATGLELVVEPWIEGLCTVLSTYSSNEITLLTEKISNCNIAEEAVAEVIEQSQCVLLGDRYAAELINVDLTVPSLSAPFLHIDYSDSTVDVSIDAPIISSAPLPADKSGLIYARVDAIDRLTDRYAVKAVHGVTLSAEGHQLSWLPGDSVGVLPCNSVSEVEAILTRVGAPIDDWHRAVSVRMIGTKRGMEHLVPANGSAVWSVYGVLRWLCDVRAPLSKAGLRAMAQCCGKGSMEEKRLLMLCAKEGQMMYIRCIREPCVSVLDLLNWFPSCTIPIERLLEFLPRLKPRAYSLCHLDTMQFAFSKVDIAPVPEFRRRPLTGVCTSWMESLSKLEGEHPTLPIYLRKNLNGFSISNPEDPHILIGPGTGVAPFIGFLQHFERLKNDGQKIGPIWLFFGCRHEERDFIFRSQLEHHLRSNVLSHLCVCFSRDSPTAETTVDGAGICVPKECKYVQHCLLHHSAELTPLVVDRGARIFVCGDAAGLAKDVLSTWSSVLLRGNHASIATQKDADGFVAKLRINKVYLEDVWL